MTAFRKLTKTVLPKPLRRYLYVWNRQFVFRRAMLRLLGDPHCLNDCDTIVSDLHYGWGNTFWSASNEYLLACTRHAWACDGPILECGSGLTTIVLGAIAQKTRQTVWTLEHNENWAWRVQRYLRRYQIKSVRVMTHPLRDYGPYCWYAPPLDELPEAFGLVVCDGPPYDTPGGRYGLLPVMGDRLPPGTTILLDDAGRGPEQNIAARWAGELGTAATTLGTKKRHRYVRLVIPEAQPGGEIC